MCEAPQFVDLGDVLAVIQVPQDMEETWKSAIQKNIWQKNEE